MWDSVCVSVCLLLCVIECVGKNGYMAFSECESLFVCLCLFRTQPRCNVFRHPVNKNDLVLKILIFSTDCGRLDLALPARIFRHVSFLPSSLARCKIFSGGQELFFS